LGSNPSTAEAAICQSVANKSMKGAAGKYMVDVAMKLHVLICICYYTPAVDHHRGNGGVSNQQQGKQSYMCPNLALSWSRDNSLNLGFSSSSHQPNLERVSLPPGKGQSGSPRSVEAAIACWEPGKRITNTNGANQPFRYQYHPAFPCLVAWIHRCITARLRKISSLIVPEY
jgi:hypothetical protein